jgi:hypothetical protein
MSRFSLRFLKTPSVHLLLLAEMQSAMLLNIIRAHLLRLARSMSSLLDLVEADFSDISDVLSDGDNFERDDDDASEDEQKDPSEPRRPRRAEIDPFTMSEEDREALRLRVIAQVEFYFGDHHYPNDQFLLEKAKEDPEGFVDIKYIMPFKKMRRLTMFPAFVAHCLRGSSSVGVNEPGNKLRRIAPVCLILSLACATLQAFRCAWM